ncbi:MAG: aromatic amino acid lyase [Pseudomonadota bacterium]
MHHRPPKLNLDGRSLTLGQVEQLAQPGTRITRAAHTEGQVRAGRAAVDAALETGAAIYGVTTSVGAFRDRPIGADVELDFNRRLLRSHTFGIGALLDPAIVRAAMAIRINTALGGQAGVRPDLLDALVGLYHAGIVPEVRALGSLGCADLGLMGPIGATLIGEGMAVLDGVRMPSSQALEWAGLVPYRPRAKEGLALVSTNATSVAAAALLIRRAFRLFHVSAAVLGLSAAGLGASRQPWRTAAVVGDGLTPDLARWILDAFGEDRWPDPERVHDPLSFRCAMQVHGAALEHFALTAGMVRDALNQSDDNPVVLDGRLATSGGSLPQRLTLGMEGLLLHIAHLARSSLSRIVVLGKREMTGLGRNLTPDDGAVLAFGPPVKQAVDLFASIADQSSAASLMHTTLADGMEDEETFLPLVTRKLAVQLDLWGKLIAHEAFTARQAVHLARRHSGLAGLAGAVAARLDRELAPIDDDRPYVLDFIAAEELLTDPVWIEETTARFPFPAFETARI